MVRDAREIPADAVIRSDICVVGGGAAGITVFLELARRGSDVVLLEGGGTRRESLSQDTYRGDALTVEPDAGRSGSHHPPLESTREKKLGGTSSWGGRCAPLDGIDFEARAHVPESGWPITRETLVPYYERANLHVEAGNFEYSSHVALPVGPSFLVQDGVDPVIDDTKLFRFSPPTNFAKSYRKTLEQSKARVFYHANVLRLEPTADGGAISSAVVSPLPGRELRVRARAFIVAAGGLETTRLLLASGRHANAPVGAGYDFVGHCYMTHLEGRIGRVQFGPRPAPVAAYSYELSRDGVYCRRIMSVTEDMQRNSALRNLGAVIHRPNPKDPSHRDSLLSAYALTKEVLYRQELGFKSRRYGLQGSIQEPIQVSSHAANVLRDPWSFATFTVDWTRRRWLAERKLPSFLREVKDGVYRVHFDAEQSPSYSNSVTLGDSLDAFGVPRLRVRWRVSNDDCESIARSLRMIGDAVERLGLGRAKLPATAEDLIEAIGGGFLAGAHAMGTTRMGYSPGSSVVDADCRVHGIGNLYIASSSVFPTSGFAAPTLTIVALAVRIADAVKRSISTRPVEAASRAG